MFSRNIARLYPSFCVALALAVVPPASAAESGELRELVGELRTMLQRAERDRLADPWFIQDVQSLLNRYDWPWSVSVYNRDFAAEGLREVPAEWQVSSGRVAMDWNRGLRSSAEVSREADARQPSGEELVGALIGGILEQALGGRQRSGERPAPAATGPARYHLPTSFSNAFALRVRLTQRPPEGAAGNYAIGVYQSTPEGAGYRLDMTTGTQGVSFALVRQSARGTAQTVEFHDGPRRLENDRIHELLWTRNAAGQMMVSLDGEPLFEVEDRSFRDRWDGVSVVNVGGDLALTSLRLDGTN